jgi:DNA-binding transcriptional LysR family regulator
MTFGQRELAAFLSIVRRGSIGSAAHALAMTQPAVSRTLKRLERRLGVALFVRHSTGMELTTFGRALKPYAELVASETGRVIEEINLLNGAAVGLARIGIVPSVAASLLPAAIDNAIQDSPGIRVRVLEAAGDQLVSALLRGEIDFAVSGLPFEPADDAIVATPLVTDDICVVARTRHPLMSKPQLLLSDLYAHPWAVPEKGNVIRAGFRSIFVRAGMEPPPAAVTTNSVHTLKSMVASTDFLTMLARVSIQIEERHGILTPVPLAAARWRREVGVLRRASGPMLPAANLVLTQMQRLARSMFPMPQSGEASPREQ